MWALAVYCEAPPVPAEKLPLGLRYAKVPQWSADGRRAAVLAEAGKNRCVVVFDTSGTRPRALRWHVLPEATWGTPGFDGSGKKFYYVAEGHRIRSVSVVSGEIIEVADGVYPLASPLGDGLIYQLPPSDGELSPECMRRLIIGDADPVPLSRAVWLPSHPAWSPTGRRIAYQGYKWASSPGSSGGFRLTERVLAVTSLNGSGIEEAVLSDIEPWWSVGLGWADSETVVLALAMDPGEARVPFLIRSYDVRTRESRELLPLDQARVLTKYGSVWISGNGKRILWQTPPKETHTYRSLDLRTGKSAELRFPEYVLESQSPDGSRVLAVGTESRGLYLAKLSRSSTRWNVERVDPR
jgi:hypothetical protein